MTQKSTGAHTVCVTGYGQNWPGKDKDPVVHLVGKVDNKHFSLVLTPPQAKAVIREMKKCLKAVKANCDFNPSLEEVIEDYRVQEVQT